jgi:hypothetical protein
MMISIADLGPFLTRRPPVLPSGRTASSPPTEARCEIRPWLRAFHRRGLQHLLPVNGMAFSQHLHNFAVITIVDAVHLFLRIQRQVKQFFVRIPLRPLQVAVLLLNDGRRRRDIGPSQGMMLVEEIRPPGPTERGRRPIPIQGRQITALLMLAGRFRGLRRPHQGGGQVDIEDEFVPGRAPVRRGLARITQHQGHANALLVGIPFPTQTVLAVEITIVRGKENQGIVVEIPIFQFLQNTTTGRIDFGDQGVVALQGFLINGRGDKNLLIPATGFRNDHGIIQKVRQPTVGYIIIAIGIGYCEIAIQVIFGGPRLIIVRGNGRILHGLGWVQGNRQSKRMIGSSTIVSPIGLRMGIEEPYRFVDCQVGDAVSGSILVLPFKEGTEIECLLDKTRAIIKLPLSNVPHIILIPLQVRRPTGLVPCIIKYGTIQANASMARHVLSGEICGPTHPTDTRRHTGMRKSYPFPGQLIQVGSAYGYIWIGNTDGIISPIVTVENQYVQAGRFRGSMAAESRRQVSGKVAQHMKYPAPKWTEPFL